MNRQLLTGGETPGLESLHELRLTVLLRDVVKQKGRMEAARTLRINYKTLAAALQSGKLTPRLCDALERLLMIRELAALDEVRESVNGLSKQVKEVERLELDLQSVLKEFLPHFNARFAVAPEQPEKAYRLVPAELSLTETISLRHTRKVARDNTIKYRWRELQLLPGTDRPSYAGLKVEILERADGQLMIRYRGEIVEFQESPQPLSSLWGPPSPTRPAPVSSPSSRMASTVALTRLRGNSWTLWNQPMRRRAEPEG